MIGQNTIGHIQPDGTIIWTRKVHGDGLGDVAQSSAIASAGLTSLKSSLASGALTPVLLQAGVSAQAIPVIGTVVGALAITAGLIANAQAKAKAINTQKAEVETKNQLLREQISELNSGLAQVLGTRDQITSQLQTIGVNVNGLGSLKSWIKETFTPGKVAQSELNQTLSENTRLTTEAQTKYDTLTYLNADLQSLFDTLTKGIFNKKANSALMWAGIGLGTVSAGIGFYYLGKKLKWF